MKFNAQDIGKTVLFTHAHPQEDGLVQESDIEGFSPSGQYVKLDHRWYDVEKVSVLEELRVQTSEPGKPERGPFGRKQVPDNQETGRQPEQKDAAEPEPADPAPASAA